jgi:glycosyltransferase involved in cell wall biosynthesis
VTTIHDLSPIKAPSHARSLTLMMRSFLWCAAHFSRAIITDSGSSKRDLMEIYGLPESKVFVVYLGYDKSIFNDVGPDTRLQAELLRRLSIRTPYILHHGTLQPRKNLKRLIEAYKLLQARKRDFDFSLVLAGKRGWECEEILAAAGSGVHARGKIVFAGAVADRDLALLVKGASLFVVPSLYEGFCLPMIEAMACGTPTVAANSSCLPEISGGVLRYFDPMSIEDMADCIENALQSVEVRKSLSLHGKERAAQFDWKRCARETVEILKASNPRVR